MRKLVLVDLGGVDVDVDDPPVLGELAELAGDPIVEPDAERQEQVGLVDGVVGVDRPVHAQHLEREIVVAGDRSQPMHGHGDGDPGLGGELAQLLGRARGDHATAAVDDRTFARPDRRKDLADPLGRRRRRQPITRQVHGDLVIRVRDEGILDVLGDVDQDRPRPARTGQVERLLDDARHIAGVLHQVMMLGDRPGDLDHRGLLERVRADDVGGHLAGDGHQRDRVHLGIGQSGDQVQRPGPEVAITTPGLPVARA